MIRKLIDRIFKRHDCRDDLATKIARLKGQLAEVAHLTDYYSGKNYDPNSVPDCWKHAQKIQCLHDLQEEYSGLTAQLIKLQNRDTQAYDKEMTR